LVAALLVDLAPALRTEVRPGGTLVASGVFLDREPDVRMAFEVADLSIEDRLAEGDWVALVARRPA
jgi:ribosomal protein L11 methylase PrmA